MRTPAASLDHRPPVLGPGVQHAVDLALADDDVLLPTDARVAEELLHVKEAARDAVDGVLAVTRAPQRPGDGDLSELIGRRPFELSMVRLTSARPSAGRRAVPAKITSSIFWLRTLLGARALSTQAIGVDHVGLAAAVRAHDHGDPWLEAAARWSRRGT